jgi:hypothetical protein
MSLYPTFDDEKPTIYDVCPPFLALVVLSPCLFMFSHPNLGPTLLQELPKDTTPPIQYDQLPPPPAAAPPSMPSRHGRAPSDVLTQVWRGVCCADPDAAQ